MKELGEASGPNTSLERASGPRRALRGQADPHKLGEGKRTRERTVTNKGGEGENRHGNERRITKSYTHLPRAGLKI